MRTNLRPQPLRFTPYHNYLRSPADPRSPYGSRAEQQNVQHLSYYYDSISSQSSPVTPLFTSLCGFGNLSLLSPYAYAQSLRHNAQPHVATAFESPFTFFKDFPREIRDKIYNYVIEDIVVKVDGSQTTAVSVLMLRPSLEPERSRLGHLTDILARSRSVHMLRANLMCISKQFLGEVRETIYRRMSVIFERRWDFVNAYINGTLQPDVQTAFNDELSLFPRGSDVFSHVRSLHLNLATQSDFDDIVYGAEAQRITTQMLRIVQQNMPKLKKLSLTIDHKSRTNAFDVIYVPDVWFLDALIAVTQVNSVEFKVGPGWNGYSQSKLNARNCVKAINIVLASHYQNQHPAHRLNLYGETGKLLQLDLAKKMLLYLTLVPQYRDTTNDFSFAVTALESQFR